MANRELVERIVEYHRREAAAEYYGEVGVTLSMIGLLGKTLSPFFLERDGFLMLVAVLVLGPEEWLKKESARLNYG
jgi:hypothetical protein